MVNVLINRRSVMVYRIARTAPMNIVAHMDVNVIPISLCVAIRNVLIAYGAVMVKMIVATILTKRVAILNPVGHHAVTMNSSVAVVIVYQNHSNVMTPMIVGMVQTRLDAVSCISH